MPRGEIYGFQGFGALWGSSRDSTGLSYGGVREGYGFTEVFSALASCMNGFV